MAGWAQDLDVVGPVSDFWIYPVAVATRVYTAQGTLMIRDTLTEFRGWTEPGASARVRFRIKIGMFTAFGAEGALALVSSTIGATGDGAYARDHLSKMKVIAAAVSRAKATTKRARLTGDGWLMVGVR